MGAYPFIEAIAVQRLAHELYLDNVPLIPRIMTELAHARTGMGSPSGGSDRHAFFRGSLHRDSRWRDGNHRQPPEDLSRSSAPLPDPSQQAGQTLRGQKRHPNIEDRVTIYAAPAYSSGREHAGREG